MQTQERENATQRMEKDALKTAATTKAGINIAKQTNRLYVANYGCALFGIYVNWRTEYHPRHQQKNICVLFPLRFQYLIKIVSANNIHTQFTSHCEYS